VNLLKRTVVAIVIASCVFGLLCLIYPFQRNTRQKPSEVDVTFDHLDSLAQACESYQSRVGAWPPNVTSLLTVVPIKNTNILVDGWGRAIVFVVYTNVTNSMWLESYGADALPKGAGMEADIVYRLP